MASSSGAGRLRLRQQHSTFRIHLMQLPILAWDPVWKPKYYESKPRIFVPRQIEVQRKVEVGGGGVNSAKPVI